MPAPKSILVAVKVTSRHARQPALRKAAQLAQATGAKLELFHAITAQLYVDAFALQGMSIPEVEKQWRQKSLKALEKHAQRLRDQGLIVVTSCDWDFPAYEAVVRRATRSGSDLIVAERHAARHVLPWLLRFNDWELLRRSPVPVLLIKRAQPWKRPVILAAIDPSHVFAKPAGLDLDILEESQALAHGAWRQGARSPRVSERRHAGGPDRDDASGRQRPRLKSSWNPKRARRS